MLKWSQCIELADDVDEAMLIWYHELEKEFPELNERQFAEMFMQATQVWVAGLIRRGEMDRAAQVILQAA